MSARYVVRPKADQDLEDQAYYLATEASPGVGHRFLVAAHQTFALLATQPEMGWHFQLKHPDLASLRVFRISGFARILTLYRPQPDGVEILRVVHGSRNLRALCVAKGSIDRNTATAVRVQHMGSMAKYVAGPVLAGNGGRDRPLVSPPFVGRRQWHYRRDSDV